MTFQPAAALKAFVVAAVLVAVTVALDAPTLALYAVALAGTAAVRYFGLIAHSRRSRRRLSG